MGLPETLPDFTPEQYLAFERTADSKHEYLDGLIYAMAGASPAHNAICANVTEIITRQLRGGACRPFTADMKVRCVSPAIREAGQERNRGLFAYPDLTVVCGEPLYHDQDHDVLINPTLIVEVLSPSTEAYDRDEKFRRYQQLESFREYLLIAQDRPLIEHYSKQSDSNWQHVVVTEMINAVFIASLQCRLPLQEVYEWVRFPIPNIN